MKMSLHQWMDQFPTEDACKDFLVQRRWPKGVRCVRCDSEKVRPVAKRPYSWQCRQCDKNGYRFSVLVGTVFENTNYPLRTWFMVIYLMLTSKKGISALQIHRTIGSGSYETAWYMCHRIRAAMKDAGFPLLTGTVEIDETYIGGKEGNRHRNKRKGNRGLDTKVGVIGAIARKGNVTCQVIEKLDRVTVNRFVAETISDKVSLVATDGEILYKYTYYGPDAQHEFVNHSEGEYVRGEVHTANLDAFWSLLKRGVIGTFHNVSKKYLPLYLNEFSWRHNHRDDDDAFGAVVATC